MSQINLNLLRSLKVLFEECHVSHAATKLNITQSALSRQLKSAARDVCWPFVSQRWQPVGAHAESCQLTKQTWALVLLNLMNWWLKEFEPSAWKGEFVFASSDYVAQYLLPEMVETLTVQAPKVSIKYCLWQPSLLGEMVNSEIQLASTIKRLNRLRAFLRGKLARIIRFAWWSNLIRCQTKHAECWGHIKFFTHQSDRRRW